MMKPSENAILLVLLIVLVCAVYYYTHLHVKVHVKEHFVETQVKQNYKDLVYEKNGIRPCQVLATSNNYMSDNFIKTMRIREWKPSETDSNYRDYLRNGSNSDYCYFFMDGGKDILDENDMYTSVIDPLGNFSNCTMQNSLFQGSRVVKNAFTSIGYDETHSLPYKKCVIEVDKAAASNGETLQTFWNRFGDTNNNAFCAGIANTLAKESTAYLAKLTELINGLVPFRNKYNSAQNLNNMYTSCLNSNVGFRQNIDTGKGSLANLQARITASNERLASTITPLLGDVNNLQKRNDGVLAQYRGRSNDLYVVTIPTLNEARQQLEKTNILKAGCTRAVNKLRTDYTQVKTQFDDKEAQYKRVSLDLTNCEKIMREMEGNITQQRPILEEFEQKLMNVRGELESCQREQAQLTEQETTWRQFLNQTQSDYDRCNKSRATLEAEIESLKQAKQALLNEIEEIKKRCRDDQSSFNLATVTIHKDAAKDIIDTEQQRCAASIAMRKRKVELMDELNGVLNQAGSCDRIIAACKCYRQVAEIGWNHSGGGGKRWSTTTGRIDEVRKHVDANPYAKFRINGTLTPIFKVTNTRRKKGSGSFIDISESHGGSPSHILMFQRV